MTSAAHAHDDPIRAAVRVLTALRDQSQTEVALGAGIPKRTMIRRMQVGGWTVSEVRGLARHFGVQPRVLLDGPASFLREEVVPVNDDDAVTQRNTARNRHRFAFAAA